MSKIDYPTSKPIIKRILKQAKQEIELRHKYKPDSIDFKKELEKRARELAENQKQLLSKKYNKQTGEEFYRLFEIDLKETVK
jgi:Fic family protein